MGLFVLCKIIVINTLLNGLKNVWEQREKNHLSNLRNINQNQGKTGVAFLTVLRKEGKQEKKDKNQPPTVAFDYIAREAQI